MNQLLHRFVFCLVSGVILTLAQDTYARFPDYQDEDEEKPLGNIIIPRDILRAGSPVKCSVRFSNNSDQDRMAQKDHFRVFPPRQDERGKVQTLVAVCNNGQPFPLAAHSSLVKECMCYCVNPNLARGTADQHTPIAPSYMARKVSFIKAANIVFSGFR